MALRKVACLTPLYFDERSCLGGGERYPLNMSIGVVEASEGGYEVEMISFGDASLTRPLAAGVTLRVLKAAKRPRNTLDVVSWELPAAIADCDLVHIHQAYTRCAEVGLLVAKQQGKPVCVTDHGGETSPLGAHLRLLDMADQIVSYSDFGASFYSTTCPSVVIKGGVDAARFFPAADPVVRDRVLYVGRLLPHKGIDNLIRALPRELPLTVCGQPYREDYYQHLKSLSAGKNVEFVTSASDDMILDLYRRAWATVLPSVYVDCYGAAYRLPELMGLTLLESMACGTPAICSRVAAMPEFIVDGETGFIFDTPDELGQQLDLLSRDPVLVARIGRRARQVVEREYDIRVAARKLVAVYERLITRAQEVAA